MDECALLSKCPSYRLCSQPAGSSWHLSWCLHIYIGTSMMFCPLKNPEFENYMGQMHPVELEIKDTTENNTSASCLDDQLHISIYDKRDDFNFHITNFPFLSSNKPASPAYGFFTSQLIQCAWACSSYECFILRATRLSNKLLEKGCVKERLKSSLKKFFGR